MARATFTGFITAMSSDGSRHPTDLESGGSGIGFQDYGSVCDLFEIVSTKSASVDTLKRWRRAALVLNSARRFRNTLDLKTKVEKKEIRAKLRTHAQVIRAAYVLPDGKPLQTRTPEAHPSPISTGIYNFKSEQFPSLTTDHDISVLQNFGVVKGMAEMLKTNPDKGINDDELNKFVRKNMFQSNIRPRKKVRCNKAPFHNDSNTLTSRGADNAHPKDWMFGDNFGKWVAFIGTYCTASAVLVAFIPLKFSGTASAYESHGWFLIASIFAHTVTIFTSWIKFYTANDVQNAMKDMYNMILNSVFLFSAIMSHLSLVLVIIIPEEISWVGYAVLCPPFVIIFVLIFLALIMVIWESARPDKTEDYC